MSRLQEIENIIIGTLLNSFDIDWLVKCSFCITADMFKDNRNSKVYSAILEFRKTGKTEITPLNLYSFDESLFPLISHMITLATDCYFLVKKLNYNENVRLARYFLGKQYRYTDVSFTDYVNKFIDGVILERRVKFSI